MSEYLQDLRKESEGLSLSDSTLIDLLHANKNDLPLTITQLREMKHGDGQEVFDETATVALVLESEETESHQVQRDAFTPGTSMNKKEVAEILEKVRGFGTSSAEWTWQEEEKAKAPSISVVRHVAKEVEENRQLKANMDAAEDVWERQKRMKARRQQRKMEKEVATIPTSTAPLDSEPTLPRAPQSQLESDFTFLPPERPPPVVIYLHSGTQVPPSALSKIRAVFTLNDINEEDIREIDIANDFEMQSVLQQQSNGNLKFPLIAIHGRLLGDLEDLMKAHNEENLAAYLTRPQLPESEEDDECLQLTVLDKMLDAGEYVVAGVGYAVTYPFAVLSSWAFGTSPQTSLPAEEIVDFKVIHCNWYWRHLRRIFRFTATCIQRIHPKHMEIRASHSYESVVSFKILNEGNAIIEYQQSSPDYFASRPSDLREMIRIILSKNCKVSVETTETKDDLPKQS